jgi:hypothetical protein
VLRIAHRAAVIEFLVVLVVVSALNELVGFALVTVIFVIIVVVADLLVVIGEASREFPLETPTTRVELPCPEHDPIEQVEGECRIVA